MMKPVRFAFPIFRDQQGKDDINYWIAHPMGGYFALSDDEVILATSNGAARLSKPSRLLAEKMQARMLGE